MADVAITILQVLVDIRDVAESIQDNDEQAHRLSERVKAIQPAVLSVKNGKINASSESLHQLLETMENVKNFLGDFKRTTRLQRVWRRRSNADKFMAFSTELSEGRQALQLDVLVDVWAKQDASDRLEDIENLKDAMRRKERNSTDNRAEFTSAVKVSIESIPFLQRRSSSRQLYRDHNTNYCLAARVVPIVRQRPELLLRVGFSPFPIGDGNCCVK